MLDVTLTTYVLTKGQMSPSQMDVNVMKENVRLNSTTTTR
jgi:hypothetical protein